MLPHCRGLEAGAAVVWFGISPLDCSHKAPCPPASSWNTGIPVRGDKCSRIKTQNTESREQFNQLHSNVFNCSHKSYTLNVFSHGFEIVWVYVRTCLSGKSASCSCSINLCLDSASGYYLFGLESRRDPRVLLGGAARVVVRDGVSLEVWYQLRHHLFQLARHRAHSMLLSHTLAVNTDLPVETRTASGFIPGDFSLIYNSSQSWSNVRYFKIS